ncbi:MAG: hypothetical protein QOK14_55 [Frankiaceae bacterium]|jgi:SAM-dependent methyltransferase|nr:hypothetical protein [Frankiaceae bacterium]
MTRRDFDDLVAEGAAVPVDGWDFSWFAGRASEERPSWGYAGLLADRMARASAALDLQTGGGEVLATIPQGPPRLTATESWAPNLHIARRNLAHLGAVVVESPDAGPLPFADASFDLVTSRHPTVTVWPEIARVLQPGGAYLSQQVGAGSNHELSEAFLGPFEPNAVRSTERAVTDAEDAGLTVVDLREETLRVTFDDIGAVVHFLRKVVWTVPGFTAERYLPQLRLLHDDIQANGPFVAHSRRFLIEARKR